LAVFTAFNILANYKFPLNEALGLPLDMRYIPIIILLLSFVAYADEEIILSFEENQVCVPETDDCLSTLTVITNQRSITLNNLIGSFFHSKLNNQILDCGGNTLSYGLNANLITPNGSKIEIVHKNGVADCGLTKDQLFYFIIDETPSLKVYDSGAKLIKTKAVAFDSLVKYKIGNKNYELRVHGVP